MTTIVKITDHQAQAIARLITEYKGKPRITGMVSAHAAQTQDLENVFYDMLTSRALENSVGVQLDRIGVIVGITRVPGQDDGAYYLAIIDKIGQNTGSATIENIIEFVRFATGAETVLLRPLYPAAFQIEIDVAVGGELATTIYRTVERNTAAGVLVSNIVGSDGDDAFAFDGDGPGGGFGDWYDHSAGGKFATIIGAPIEEPEEDDFMSKHVTVSFDGVDPVVDIDTQVLGFNSQKCGAFVLDADDAYKDVGLVISRPDQSTIRLTQGSAVALNLRVLIFEAKD